MLAWKKSLSKRINPMVLFFNFDNVSFKNERKLFAEEQSRLGNHIFATNFTSAINAISGWWLALPFLLGLYFFLRLVALRNESLKRSQYLRQNYQTWHCWKSMNKNNYLPFDLYFGWILRKNVCICLDPTYYSNQKSFLMQHRDEWLRYVKNDWFHIKYW